ncbi:hypothetical protein [Altererythrobacter sp. MF3-039]
MFDRRFLKTRLGKAAVLSVAMMATFVALSSQMHATPAFAATSFGMVELA